MSRTWATPFKRSVSSPDAICRICAVIRRAERSSQLDPVTALSIAAEMDLEDLPPSLYKQAVSSFLRLDEEDALELMRQLPFETHLADDRHEDCPLVGNCEYRGLLLHYLTPSFEHV